MTRAEQLKAAAIAKLEVNSIPVPESGCWLWTTFTKKNGYGQLLVNNKLTLAHRLSYEAYVGPIPGGLYVCHKCDTPSCINPTHLFLGTRDENIHDAWKKGRMKGQNLAHCKRGHEFTPENTMAIYRGKKGIGLARRGCRICKALMQKIADRRRKQQTKATP